MRWTTCARKWTTLQGQLATDATNYTYQAEFNETAAAAATIRDEKRLNGPLDRRFDDRPLLRPRDGRRCSGRRQFRRHHRTRWEDVVPVPGDNAYPGQNAAFAIPKELPEKFMAGFVGDPSATATFDNAAGTQYHNALLAAALADAAAGPGHDEAMNHLARAYGMVAGTENHVTTEVFGEQHKAKQESNEVMHQTSRWGWMRSPARRSPRRCPASPGTWPSTSETSGWKRGFGDTDDPRFEALGEKSHEIALVQPYETLSILQEAGYPGTDKVPASLLDPTTHLMLPMNQVLGDPGKVTALQDYVNATKNDPANTRTSVFDKSNDVSGNFSGGFDTGTADPRRRRALGPRRSRRLHDRGGLGTLGR
ncbi:MAG: hypothetical protein WCB04_11560 [Mycobacteriales bacterium]